MNTDALYRMLKLPEPVAELFRGYDLRRDPLATGSIAADMLVRERWSEAVRALQARIGEDPDGLILLWEQLRLALDAHVRYRAAGISDEIFAATFRIATRSLNESLRAYGKYRFLIGWWFPRELALQEFRLGSLEFEITRENAQRAVFIHIPSDASLKPVDVDESLRLWSEFAASYFPAWRDAPLRCDSWMLSPALPALLDADSNILAFQRRFRLTGFDEGSMGAVEWIFPGHKKVSADLPEDTSLQRRTKAFLLSGGKIGWADGTLKE